MKVLITGHRGFIGTWLGKFFDESEINWYGMDIVEGNDIEDTPIDEKTTHIVHLAAEASVIGDTLPDIQTNILKFEKFLSHIPPSVRHIVFASSSAVYGDDGQPKNPIPILTETTPPNPICVYGLSKLWGEHRLRIFGKQKDIRICSLRFPNVIGWGQPSKTEGNIIPKMFDFVYNGKPLVIRGPGASRDFVDIRDIARAISRFMIDDEAKGIFCLGSGRSIGLHSLLYMIKDITHTMILPGGLTRGPLFPGEMVHTRISHDLAEKEIGFSPAYTLEDTLEWCNECFLEEKEGCLK